ncbi:MAG TPA: hypothetical protein VF667_10290 [Pseudonocardia sp.]
MTGTWTQRAGFYVEHLSELGYRPQIDDDGDIYFRHEGGHYYILGTDDEQYVQLAYLNFWPIEDDDELRRALLAASVANRNTKVAKVSVRPDLKDMHVTAEVFLARPTDLVDVFERLVGAIQTARATFAQEVRRPT